MDKNELISRILSYDNKIGRWKLYINEISNTDYAIGYGYDDSTKLKKNEATGCYRIVYV